ncbi:MAG: DHH family phosphoesterase, partial [Acidobacteria bacterium]|nr:DHH family phosphoesterase [Acidobacteriota bacterium]
MISDLTRQRYAAFRSYVEALEQPGRWLILTHDNPDPDSLASAFLLSRVLHQGLKQKVTLAYSGIIGRAENREMVRTLGFRFSHLRHLNLKQYKHFALVDTQPRTGNNSLPEDIVPTLVIDHHPMRRATAQVPLSDIRTEYGATATILAEYLLASGLTPSKPGATATVYAIRSETQDFARESPGPDKAIHDLMLARANKRLLGKIQSAPLPATYFRNLHEALENLQSVDTLVLSHLGVVEQPDIVPEIADLLLRLEGKTWALCTGLYGQRIYLSIRTTNP